MPRRRKDAHGRRQPRFASGFSFVCVLLLCLTLVPAAEASDVAADNGAAGAVAAAAAPATRWGQLGGLAQDEGAAVPGIASHQNCDVACCRAACDDHVACNSFAHLGTACFLKQKCIAHHEDTGAATEPVRESKSWKTHFRVGPCPRDESSRLAAAAANDAEQQAEAAREAEWRAQLAADGEQPKQHYTYAPVGPFPPAAGQPLPKLYREPLMDAPFASLPKGVSELHCDFLVASGIKWVMVLGDSVARSFGVAMMEHLAGDDVRGWCDCRGMGWVSCEAGSL
jgi:hypothetical protein